MVARLVPSWRRGRRGRRGSLRGRRGTWRHRPSLCVAGVALGDMDVHFAWQVWHLWHWTGCCGALGSQLTPCRRGSLRGRRGTWRHRLPLCVAGVALGDIDVHSAWQAWHSWHWAGSGARGFPVDAVDAVALWVARVALGDIDRYFAWQGWHLATSTFTLRGRRGTYGTGLGGALGSQLTAWTPQLFGTWRHGTGLALVARLVPS